jgi:hypothetical protein
MWASPELLQLPRYSGPSCKPDLSQIQGKAQNVSEGRPLSACDMEGVDDYLRPLRRNKGLFTQTN